MKTAITLFAIVGMTALQAYAAPIVDSTSLSGVPMSVAKRLNPAPMLDTAAITVEKSGAAMRVATRTNQAVQPTLAVASGDTDIQLSGLRACHAKRT